MTRIGIILGSTRPGRVGLQIANWIDQEAQSLDGAAFQLVDLADYDLPVFDEPKSTLRGDYEHEHTRIWSAAIADLDGFVFVTPEYNRSIPAAGLSMPTVAPQLALSLLSDFEAFTTFVPTDRHRGILRQLLDDLIAWSEALHPLRQH